MYFHTNKLKNERNNHDHDLIFYYNHNPLWMPEDKIFVQGTWNYITFVTGNSHPLKNSNTFLPTEVKTTLMTIGKRNLVLKNKGKKHVGLIQKRHLFILLNFEPNQITKNCYSIIQQLPLPLWKIFKLKIKIF